MTWHERREPDWLPVDEALHRLLSEATPGPVESMPAAEALGRALAEPLHAGATLPPFDNSAMDGYAVRKEDVRDASEDRPIELAVREHTLAGDPPAAALAPGEAVRIMTGAPVPHDVDTVVRVEHTDAEAERPGYVRIRSAGDVGRNVRPGGQDMVEGDLVLEAGTTITPGVLAVITALGHSEVPVHRAPRVGILSSGDELRTTGEFDDVRAGRGIPDTNSVALGASVREAGGVAVPLGIARDDRADIRRRVEEARECDALVTTGGASMGEADLFKRALVEMGLEIRFWRIRIRPGSPFSSATLPAVDGAREPLPVLGLPGNPASAFVTFQVLVRPYVMSLAGHRRVHRRVIRAVAGERFSSTPRLTHFHRVALERDAAAGDGYVARLTGPQGSGLVRSLGAADGLAVVPEGVDELRKGDPTDVILLDDAGGPCASVGYRVRSRDAEG